MTKYKLKPCPFCGNMPTIRVLKGKDGWRDRYAVLCNYDDGGCGAEGGQYHYEAEAVNMWNTRVSEYASDDLISKSEAVAAIEKRAEKNDPFGGKYEEGVTAGLGISAAIVGRLKPAQEQRKAVWTPIAVSTWECSACGRRARGKIENLPYCHCGARMVIDDD